MLMGARAILENIMTEISHAQVEARSLGFIDDTEGMVRQ
jgi:hypothetical protein